MSELYNKINASIEGKIDAYMELVKAMYDNPEIGFQEFETQKLLVAY